jgi:hypothetical protein
VKILKKTLRRTATLAVLSALAVPALPGPLHVPPPVDDEDDKDDEKSEEKEDRWFALVGGDVHTGTGSVLRGATILAKNGKIEEIGYRLYVPEEAEVLDASGMRVYPGLVALNATARISSGLFSADGPEDEDPLEDHHHDPHYGLDDVVERGVRFLYGHLGDDEHDEHDEDDFLQEEGEEDGDSKLADSFDPFSQYLVLALATGITTAEQSGAALKLKRGEIDGVVMKEGNLASISWSVSNPSSIRKARENFEVAAAYKRERQAWNKLSDKKKKDVKEPKKPKGFDNKAFAVLTGNALAKFNANDREDLLGIARFAQEYGFRPVIMGCREGWTVADELGRAGAYAVITARDRSPKDEKLVRPGGTSIENAAILHEHGVQVAIRPGNTGFDLGGITGRDLMHLPVEAAFGVRGGLPEEAALAAISIVPARILGVDHRVGTLEVGKDMDAIVTDGDILHYQTFTQWAVVDGKEVYDKEQEIFFAHIRPRPKPPEPEAEPEPEPEPPAEEAEPEPTDEPAEEEESTGDDASGDEGEAGGESEEASDDETTDEDGR